MLDLVITGGLVLDYRWDLTRVSESPTRPDYAGLTLAEIGGREGKAPVDALLDLLLADGGRTGGIYFHIDEGDVRAIMRDPHVGVGSDGLYTGRPGHSDRGRPHPRHFGTFPRVLGRYARDEGVLTLPEAIRKMTSLSADVLGLRDRGRIRVEAAADLVVFDPATIADRATFEAPHQPPGGDRGGRRQRGVGRARRGADRRHAGACPPARAPGRQGRGLSPTPEPGAARRTSASVAASGPGCRGRAARPCARPTRAPRRSPPPR